MDWSLLSQEHPLIVGIIDQWEQMLRKEHSEKVYHEFLRRHANLFLVDGREDSYFAISKLKLGSEWELDFAIPSERHSMGLYWELIEIKTPHQPPYSKKGTPSAGLTEATQQIRNWKRWIQSSRSEAKKLFSLWRIRTERQPNFRYTIVIGTRQNSEKWLDERNQYSEENGVSVHSFDYLTDRVKKRWFFDSVFVGSDSWDAENPDLRRKLANPFFEAFTDSQWKEFLREPDAHGPHFIAGASRSLLDHLPKNLELLDAFANSQTPE